MTDFGEDSLIEQPAIALFRQIGWQAVDCFDEAFGKAASLGRDTPNEIVLLSHLSPALQKLNPGLPEQALQLAVEELTRDRSIATPAEANRQVYELLKNGVPVTYRDAEGIERFERVQVIDWTTPANNDFFLASQLWISGEIYKRRADLVGFVNGLPLVFIELKATHKALKNAFDNNLKDYKYTIPQLFWYNAFIILSNGSQSKIGSLTSAWEHFNDWKKINSEGEEGIISLETMLRSVCQPERLLDLVENFILFEEAQGGLRKIIAKNHQYLGVNNSLKAVQNIRQNHGRLGVFWHTQGSGKSYSMIFFSQKVLRKLPGNWTFLVVTDRQELDEQIYKNFANCRVVHEMEHQVRAGSGEHLQALLKEDHRYLFTLIQKFHPQNAGGCIERGQTYPLLSERDDIIVMTDEAHRSQYDVLALNMRNALPNAAFLAFTGTPLMAGEEKTRQVFGDYVSVYNFKASVDDQATVPLYYENRIPELQLVNPDLNAEMAELLDDAMLDEDQEVRLEREFSREYYLITRDDRLEKIAEDIVLHFLGRGYQGKAMVISIDKATAIKMFNKVQKYWKYHQAVLEAELDDLPEDDRPVWREKIKFMHETDMAVVVSQGQNEVADMAEKGLDILPHRKRMLKEDLATKFKEPKDPFRLVFLCAMWMTGFDAPSCSTIYLDKPMKNHTLMQTIARANRVFGEKVNGLIVDYIGVFRELQKALAIYGSGVGGALGEGELPVKDKQALVDLLRSAIQAAREFLTSHGVDLQAIRAAEEFNVVKLLDDAVDALFVNDDTQRQYLLLAGSVDRLFSAILPDKSANEFAPDRKVMMVIAEKMRANRDPVDISQIMDEVDKLLDESIAPKDKGYIIYTSGNKPYDATHPGKPMHWVDLSRINFEALRKGFAQSHKRTEIERLRVIINAKLKKLIQYNRARMNFYEQFQKMIDDYNAGRENVDAFFAELVSFVQGLNIEEQRGVAENLSEEELAVFDLLTRPNLKLSKSEREKVREVARQLLDTLKAEYLVLDWRKNQQTRAGVKVAIEEALDRLPKMYNDTLYEEKCDLVYQHIYDSYFGPGKNIYLS
jgi:type I restriction enzyme R subunit